MKGKPEDIAVIVPAHTWVDIRMKQKLQKVGIFLVFPTLSDRDNDMPKLQGRSFSDVRVAAPYLEGCEMYKYLTRHGSKPLESAEPQE